MVLRLRKEETIYLVFSLIILVLSCTGIINSYTYNMYILIIVYVSICVLTLRYRNFSIYQIFLVTYFFFLLGRIVLDVMGTGHDMRTLALFQNSVMSDDVACITIRVLIVFLIGTSYAWLFSNKKIILYTTEHKIEKPDFNNILEWLYYVYIVLFIVKMFYIFSAVRQYGYLTIFSGDADYNMPFFLTGVVKIAEALFIILVFFNRDKKHFVKYSVLLLIAGFFKALTGQRAYGLVLLCFVIFLYSSYYKEIPIFNWKTIVLALVIPIFINVISQFRWGDSISVNHNIYTSVLWNQSCSIEVVSDTIMLKEQFTNRVPFFVGYIVDFFDKEPMGHVVEDVINGNYLEDHLMYILNPQMYFKGFGTGTSIVAEGYELVNGNMFLLFIFGFLITSVALYLANNMFKNIYMFAISYYYLSGFIFCPRDSVLKSLEGIVFALFACFVVRVCMRLSSSYGYKRVET